MEQQNHSQSNDETFIASLILGGFGLVVAERLWSQRVKPWVTDQLGSIKLGDGGALAQIGSFKVETIDLVGISILLLPVMALIWWLRRSLRARRRERAEA